jgi:hypothetical protein
LAAHPVVAFLQKFFGDKACTNLLALKKQFFILVFAAVCFELLQVSLAFLSIHAPGAALGVIIKVVEYWSFG